MVHKFQPRLVAMTGIAAGCKEDKQGYGDVLAAEITFDYGAGKIEENGETLEFHPEPNPITVNANLLNRLKEWARTRNCLDDIKNQWIANKPNTSLSLHVGPLSSGAAVVNSPKPLEEVGKHWRKLIGIEMEAYAVYYACYNTVTPPPLFLCFKSICDFAKDKNDDWQNYAAYASAQFLYRFVKAEWKRLFPRP